MKWPLDGPELLGEVQQRLGQPPLGIGGDEIEHGHLPFSQPAGEMTEQHLDRARLQQLREDVPPRGAANDGDVHGRGGLLPPRPGEARLSEHFADAEDGQQAVLTLGGCHGELHLSGIDQIQRVVVIAGGVERPLSVEAQPRRRQRVSLEHIAQWRCLRWHRNLSGIHVEEPRS